MAFLRVEKKKSGTYLRIVQSYKVGGKSKHKTLHSLGKLEDYPADQLERIASKLLELVGRNIEDIVSNAFHELGRYNYGYAVVIHKIWKLFDLNRLVRRINNQRRITFEWDRSIQLMIGERINDPCSKRQSSFNQEEYLGFSEAPIPLHHFYRALDLLHDEEELIKQHIFSQQSNLFSTVLDVVFYDVTTLYFDSQVEQEGALRQKGYSKDGKAHKTQVVLGLLVDKFRNPISYEIYQGNTYEGQTMIDAIKRLKSRYKIDKVVVVADSAMIDKDNRAYMTKHKINYILGDRIKSLGSKITSKLLDKESHILLNPTSEESLSYTEQVYKGRRIICTYSPKRARKDVNDRQKLIDKASKWLEEPSKYKQVKKRGAGRFITSDQQGVPIKLNQDQIMSDSQYDGYKAISTTVDLGVEEILSKYRDLFEVEHTFRTLKSQLEIRPMFHWTDKRIKGHICMCFMAYTFMNYLRNQTGLQYRKLIKTLDAMQLSQIQDDNTNSKIYLRSAISPEQQLLIEKLKIRVPNDTIPQSAINQYFTK